MKGDRNYNPTLIMEINHYTLNTGHMIRSRLNDIDRETYFPLMNIIERAKKENTDFLDGTSIRIIEMAYGYVCTLYGKYGDELIPILSTAGTDKEEGRYFIWKTMQEMAETEYGNHYIKKVPVAVPYIVDLEHSSSVYFPQILTWTGGFAKCMGWMMLYPDKVRVVLGKKK